MSRIGEITCALASRVLPARRVEGRESPRAYAEAQYRWAPGTLAQHAPHVDLRGATLLDAGCGLGGKAVWFAEHGCSAVAAVDADPLYIAEGKNFAAERGVSNVSFGLAQLDALPFPDGSFDIVMLNDVLEHIIRPRLVPTLSELRRVLKVGGRLCIDFSPWTSHDAGHLYDYIRVPWCQVLFSEDTLIRVTEQMAPRATHGTRGTIDHFRELNRLTVEEFHDLVTTLHFVVIARKRHMIRGIDALARVPLVHDFLTSRILAVLSK